MAAASWLGACAVLALSSLLAWGGDRTLLEWQPARAWSEPWRWCSAAAVHYSAMHLLLNLLATALVAAYGWAARVGVVVSLAWIGSWPLTHLALLAQPQLLHYGGLSGLLHGGAAAVTLWLIVRGVLHAQGWDHELEEDAQVMELRETEIMQRLGFNNPY